jgi:hypothetical protein
MSLFCSDQLFVVILSGVKDPYILPFARVSLHKAP